MSLPERNSSTYTLPPLNTGNLLKEDGDELLLENGDSILLENPTQDPQLSSRSTSSYSLPNRS